MGAINGTSILLYSDGQPIAMQKGLTFGWDVDLPDATNKGSAGWAEHISGIMNAKIDFNALFSTGLMSDTPAVLSAKDLMDYIINSKSLLVAILGGAFPVVGAADLSSLSFDAPMEAAMTLSGSLKINGGLYPLTGSMVNLASNPDGGGTDYDTFTHTATSVTSAINAAGSAYAKSDVFTLNIGSKFKIVAFIVKTSGELPSVSLIDSGGTDISDAVALVEGLNSVTLISTGADVNSALKITNSAAANWNATVFYGFYVT